MFSKKQTFEKSAKFWKSAGFWEKSASFWKNQSFWEKSEIPVVHLDLQISPQIFNKIRNGPNSIFSGLGEDDS
jgi:hypothetical protein